MLGDSHQGGSDTRFVRSIPAPSIPLIPPLVATMLVAILACSSSTISTPSVPDVVSRIVVEHPMATVVGTNEVDLPVRVEGTGAVLMSFAVSPPDLATASAGKLRCKATGQGTVAITASGQSASVPFSCAIVASIDVPASLKLMTGVPSPFAPRALDASGAEIKGVEVTPTVADAAIVSFEAGSLKPRAVGRTTVSTRISTVEATTSVEVDAKQADENFDMVDGSAKAWDLPAGNFNVSVRTQGQGAGAGVSVRWEGPGCGARPTAASHQFSCSISGRGRIYLDNPNHSGADPVESGHISIVQVPR